MDRQFLIVRSITYAIKSRELLFQYHIKAYIERLPKSEQGAGCGYGVYVPEHPDEAERLLKAAGIPVIGRRECVQAP